MGQRFKSVSRQMISPIKGFVLSDSKFLVYLLPKRLKEEDIFSVTTLSFGEKNLEFEILGFNIINMEQSISFLNSLENRFCLYEDTPFFEYQEFSFCGSKLDLSTKRLLFGKEHTKLIKGNIIPSFLRDKKMVANGTFLIKSRLLSLTKGGFVSSCFNGLAYINCSSFFLKFIRQKSYKSWFSLNIGYYGFLSYFTLIYSKNRTFTQSLQQGFFLSRVKFYCLQNEGIKHFYLLAKPKHF